MYWLFNECLEQQISKNDCIKRLFYTSSSKQSIKSKLIELLDQLQLDSDFQSKTYYLFINLNPEADIASELSQISAFNYDNSPDDLLDQRFEEIFKISDAIVHFSISEDNYFRAGVLNRETKSRITKELWPNLKEQTLKIFDVIGKNPDGHTKFICVDNDSISNIELNNLGNLNELTNPLFDYLFGKIKRESLTNNHFVTDLKQAKKNLTEQKIRPIDNSFVSTIRKNCMSSFFRVFENFQREFLNKFQNCYNQEIKYELIDEFINIYANRHILFEEEKSVFKNVISTDSEYSICSVLIYETISMCKNFIDETQSKISQNDLENQISNKNDPLIIRIISISDILENIGRHLVFRQRIFVDPNFISLIKCMLQSNSFLIKIFSTQLLSVFLECDHKVIYKVIFY